MHCHDSYCLILTWFTSLAPEGPEFMTPGPTDLSHPDIVMILWNWKQQDSCQGESLKGMSEWLKGKVLFSNQVTFVKTFRFALGMKQLASDRKLKMVSRGSRSM